MSYNTKNYTEQGGEKTVIGGLLVILPGATIRAEEGAEVEGFGTEPYVLPPATDETLGGIIVGHGLDFDESGVLSNSMLMAEKQEDSTATNLAELVVDFNDLLLKLKNAGIMDDE